MIDTPSIQWFPGHMAKTRRLMRDSLKMVDIVIELTDARIPQSSRNPEIDKLIGNKPRIVLLNKADAADESMSRAWCDFYAARNIPAMAVDCRSGKGLKAFVPLLKKVLAPELARRENRGNVGKPIRMMVVGIPNVGKSSFINRMAGGKKTKVEDRPGVTRAQQWVKVTAVPGVNNLDLLDMPGVLWPKFEDPLVGEKLAFTGAIKDDIMDIEQLAARLLDILNREYRGLLCERYRLDEEELADIEPFDLLALIGRKRGMLISGGEVNLERAAIMVLDEFRSGKIGRISLEAPPAKGAQ
ncbi:ribosome biogenesis GTPase YlqF [Zongyangia hominis]|uniref:Ribosome biogenesis GTPase A n=1 Tax=Zongyangia hominis TaxID=2763677 RepID=A0A926EC62_9FIRM|nr:ribosome biogenesis GTPase YlqF [Zongyangia hominis]MBC8569544.1 ribosome biogenesis GTPase YlqF [Zongyangia hominis]